MKVDVTYKSERINKGVRLRVRFRREDGQSAVGTYYPAGTPKLDVSKLGATEEIKTLLANDLVNILNNPGSTLYRLDLELPENAPQDLGAGPWQKPRTFSLEYEKDRVSNQIVLRAKEWDCPQGEVSSRMEDRMSEVQLKDKLARIGLNPAQVQSAEMPRVTHKRVSEDDIEILFNPTKPLKDQQSTDGVVMDL